MERLILVRHAESEYSVKGLLSGDHRIAVGLTDAGREQARELGARLAGEEIDLCVTTEFARTIETADIVFAGRDIPRLVVPELNDHPAGDYEGRPIADYLEWAHTSGPLDPVPGTTETRAAVVARFLRGYSLVSGRPERTVVAVLHSLPIVYLLEAAAGADPAARVRMVPYAEPRTVRREQLESAIARLRRWLEDPAW
jgi:broad specificity phosphatase PhoE